MLGSAARMVCGRYLAIPTAGALRQLESPAIRRRPPRVSQPEQRERRPQRRGIVVLSSDRASALRRTLASKMRQQGFRFALTCPTTGHEAVTAGRLPYHGPSGEELIVSGSIS